MCVCVLWVKLLFVLWLLRILCVLSELSGSLCLWRWRGFACVCVSVITQVCTSMCECVCVCVHKRKCGCACVCECARLHCVNHLANHDWRTGRCCKIPTATFTTMRSPTERADPLQKDAGGNATTAREASLSLVKQASTHQYPSTHHCQDLNEPQSGVCDPAGLTIVPLTPSLMSGNPTKSRVRFACFVNSRHRTLPVRVSSVASSPTNSSQP